MSVATVPTVRSARTVRLERLVAARSQRRDATYLSLVASDGQATGGTHWRRTRT